MPTGTEAPGTEALAKMEAQAVPHLELGEKSGISLEVGEHGAKSISEEWAWRGLHRALPGAPWAAVRQDCAGTRPPDLGYLRRPRTG